MTSTHRHRVGRRAVRPLLQGVACLVLGVGVAACSGEDEESAAPTPTQGPTYATPQEAYEAVVAAYVAGECDEAALLVDGTSSGVEQFLSGCEERENLEVIETIEVTGRNSRSTVRPLPDNVTKAVRLSATFTDESGSPTSYDPDMVKIDDRWKLWLPGDQEPGG